MIASDAIIERNKQNWKLSRDNVDIEHSWGEEERIVEVVAKKQVPQW